MISGRLRAGCRGDGKCGGAGRGDLAADIGKKNWKNRRSGSWSTGVRTVDGEDTQSCGDDGERSRKDQADREISAEAQYENARSAWTDACLFLV